MNTYRTPHPAIMTRDGRIPPNMIKMSNISVYDGIFHSLTKTAKKDLLDIKELPWSIDAAKRYGILEAENWPEKSTEGKILINEKGLVAFYAKDKDNKELKALYVRPPYRRQGIASGFLKESPEVDNLLTEKWNRKAQKMYKQQGFEREGYSGKYLKMKKSN